MAEVKRVGTLEVEEDLKFQRGQWRATRMLWLFLVLVVTAAALGLFGNGPLSRRRAGSPDAPIWAEYERVARNGASLRLVVHARPQTDGSVRFTIERALLEAFRIQQITPAPAAEAFVEDGIEYRFAAGMPGTVAVTFEMQPAAWGRVGGRVASPDGAVRLNLFILP